MDKVSATVGLYLTFSFPSTILNNSFDSVVEGSAVKTPLQI